MKNPNHLRILILGGYGHAGLAIAKLLLQEFPKVELILAGRNLEKAREVVRQLSISLQTTLNQLLPQQLDAGEETDLIRAFSRVDLVVNAASTIPYTRQVLTALLATGADYIDTQLSSSQKWSVLRARQEELVRAKVCLISDGGFHPGLPAALVRYAAKQLEEIESALVYGGLRIDWTAYRFSGSTIKELVDEFKDFKPLLFQDGRWKTQSFRKIPVFDFGEPIGKLACTPMDLAEMHLLPEEFPSLKRTGFFVSGFNKIIDNWLIPIVYTGIKLLPQKCSMPFARLFQWGLKFNKPPFGIKLVADCRGYLQGEPAGVQISVSHADGYVLTAVPVVACIHQWASGQIRQPGLWTQANIVEPAAFLSDLQRMGLRLEVHNLDQKTLPIRHQRDR